jgi:hypothetical protein
LNGHLLLVMPAGVTDDRRREAEEHEGTHSAQLLQQMQRIKVRGINNVCTKHEYERKNDKDQPIASHGGPRRSPSIARKPTRLSLGMMEIVGPVTPLAIMLALTLVLLLCNELLGAFHSRSSSRSFFPKDYLGSNGRSNGLTGTDTTEQ